MSRFRILCVDGGGVKGIVAATIIARIQSKYNDFIESVDMFSGTSTGSIISCGLAIGMSTEDVINLYMNCGKTVFKRNIRHIFSLTGSKYSNDGLKNMLNATFKNKKIGDVKKKILIPTFCLCSSDEPRRWKPKFFHNFGEDVDKDCLLSDVILQSCSAPTYFPAYNGHIDGGVVSNNPSMAALCQAIDPRYKDSPKIDNINLLSIGTGESYRFIENPNYNFGIVDTSSIVKILLGGTESVPDYQCKVILGEMYKRIDPFIEKDVNMDDYKKVSYLRCMAENFELSDCEDWIYKKWLEDDSSRGILDKIIEKLDDRK